MKVLILNYHRVCPGYHIDPETFEWQIKTLKEKFIPLTLDDSVSFVKGKLNLKKDGFAITFDDGWADNFIYAYPILKKLNIPATIFISTDFISKNKEYLTWEKINVMKPLIKVESHGQTHAYHFRSPKIIDVYKDTLTKRQTYLLLSGIQLKAESPIYESGSVLAYQRYYEKEKSFENFNDYEDRVKTELKTSMAEISKNTGFRLKYLAWPFGEYNKTAIEIAKKIGFQSCFTTKQGFIKQNDDYYRLKRFSPPRNNKIFLIAIKGNWGMVIYKLIIFILSIF